MTSGVKDVELVPAKADEQSLAPVQPQGSELVLMFERLAKDPNVDVDKLERLIAMNERIMRHQAKAAFDADFAQMQPEIPIVDERGRIEVKGTLRSTYAPLEDIHEVIKPIIAKFGFAVRHRTEWPDDRKGIIRIVGILSHRNSHSEESVFEAPMDRSEYRSDIQSMGSTVSYGRRYTTMDLLNIATRKADNDGQKRQEIQAPDGFENWWLDLQSVADEGLAHLHDAWNKSKPEFKRHVQRTSRGAWESLKTRAAKVQP